MPPARIERAMFNVVADQPAAVRDFYTTLLDFETIHESDRYIVLMPREGPRFELGIIRRDSDATPIAAGRPFGGGYLTFAVPEVLVAFEQARAMGADIIEPPTELFSGQRRMLLSDPAGTIIDISSPAATMTA